MDLWRFIITQKLTPGWHQTLGRQWQSMKFPNVLEKSICALWHLPILRLVLLLLGYFRLIQWNSTIIQLSYHQVWLTAPIPMQVGTINYYLHYCLRKSWTIASIFSNFYFIEEDDEPLPVSTIPHTTTLLPTSSNGSGDKSCAKSSDGSGGKKERVKEAISKPTFNFLFSIFFRKTFHFSQRVQRLSKSWSPKE